MRANRSLILLPIAALLGASAFPLPAKAVEKTLPGGTRIAVEISSPADGAILPPGPVTVSGRAEIGVGQPRADTALVYVLDVSGSTTRVVDCGDGPNKDILDCEVAAATKLNDLAIGAKTVDKVSVVVFGTESALADVSPDGGDQKNTDPEAGPGHINTVLSSAFNSAAVDEGGVRQFALRNVHSNTSFVAGIAATADALDSTEKRERIAIFMSDGVDTVGGDLEKALDLVPATAKIHTFAVGSGSECGASGDGQITLQRIAERRHGKCTEVTDFNKLPEIIPGVIASHLTALTLSVDGGDPVPITNVNPPLPATGPKTVDYTATTGPLASGKHKLCVIATGDDVGGPDSVEDCRTITINARPLVDAGGPYSGNEDDQIDIAGTVTDPDNPDLKTTWSIKPVSGVPPGSVCTFVDAGAVSTKVSCTERGTYELTLTADDGVNPPVSDSTPLTLTNVPPTVSPGGPYSGNEDTQIPIAGTVTDPDNPNPTTTWTIVPTPGVTPGATCTFGDPKALSTVVSCTDHGVYNLTLTADDGVNPPVSNSTTLTLTNVAPKVSAGGPYTGEEDHPVPIAGTVTDPDSPGLTTTWSITPLPGATCTFVNASALSTSVACTQPGTYTLTLTVNDNVNPPVTASTTVTLKQTPGALSLHSSVDPAPGFVGGDPVVVTHTVSNGGPGPLAAIHLTTTLPAALQPAAVSPAGCASACDLGTLAPGQSVQVKITFTPAAPLDQPVSASVTTSGPDPVKTDNTATARVVILQPVLTIDPGVGPQGFVTHAIGKNFPAGAKIRLQWSIGLSETPGQVTVRPDGTIDAQALIFPKDTRGLRALQAIPVTGPKFGTVTSNPFLVFARSLKPMLFVIR